MSDRFDKVWDLFGLQEAMQEEEDIDEEEEESSPSLFAISIGGGCDD